MQLLHDLIALLRDPGPIIAWGGYPALALIIFLETGALVAFLPGRHSRTWARIRHAGSFCVNVLTCEQLELCSALRETQAYRDVPFVLISADADPELTQRAGQCGVTSVVRKGSLQDGRFSDTVRDLAALTH